MLAMKRLHLLCLIAVLLCAACATPSGGKGQMGSYSAEQLQSMGEKFLAAGDFIQAIKYLTAAEQKRPKDATLLYYIGVAYSGRKMHTEALAYFQKALAEKPDYPEAYNAMGAVYADRGQLDQAQNAFQKVLNNSLYETPQFARYNLGRVFEKKGDPLSALQQYQEAARLQPTYALAYLRIGLVQESQSNNYEARKAFALAVQYGPDLAEAHMHYAILSFGAGDFDSALYSFARVIRLVPNTPDADEARRYLDKIAAAQDAAARAVPYPSRERPARVEMITQPQVRYSEPSQPEIRTVPPSPAPEPVRTEQPARLEPPVRVGAPGTAAPLLTNAPPVTAVPPATAAPPATATAAAPATAAAAAPAAMTEPPAGVEQSPKSEMTAMLEQPARVESPAKAEPPAGVGSSAKVEQPAPVEPPAKVEPASIPATSLKGEEPARVEQTAKVEQATAKAPEPEVRPEPAQPPAPQFKFVVQVGSFEEKEGAEQMQVTLLKKGYSAVVRRVKDRTKGMVYVLQLKPVDTLSKASTMAIQLETEVRSTPTVVRVPGN